MPTRLDRLRHQLQKKNLSALLISNDQNRRYITSFTGSAGFVLVTAKDAILLTDSRYTEQATEQAQGFDVRLIAPPFNEMLVTLCKDLGVSTLSVEAANLTVATFNRMQEKAADAGIVLNPVEDVVEPIRMVKDAGELAALERAIKIGDAAVVAATKYLKPGMTEKEVAWYLEKFMRENGAEAMAFEVIVASGPRSAMPHARPSDRIIEPGDPIVMDLGAVVDGYHGDLTRTVCYGQPSDEYLGIWGIVLAAQKEAERRVKPGMTGGEVDAFSRDLIDQAGYRDKFGHSLGHGVGLEIHEGPWVRDKGDGVLEPGMVFSVEPGIYLPGEFGVRIEDLVVLEADGCRVLSASPKTPTIVE